MGNKASSSGTPAQGEDGNRPHKGKLYGLKKRLSFRKKKTETEEANGAATEEVISPTGASKSESAPRSGKLSPKEKLKIENRERRGSVADTSVNTVLWQKILDDSIVGTKLVQKAIIYRLATGSIIVSNPADFRPSTRQLVTLSEGLHDPSKIAKDGINLLADNFQYTSGVPGSQIEGVDEAAEQVVILQAGQAYAMVGITSWSRRDDAKKMFSELREYFASQSEF